MVYVGLGEVPRRSYAPVMTKEEDYRLATIEHRLAWIERRLGAPMSCCRSPYRRRDGQALAPTAAEAASLPSDVSD